MLLAQGKVQGKLLEHQRSSFFKFKPPGGGGAAAAVTLTSSDALNK